MKLWKWIEVFFLKKVFYLLKINNKKIKYQIKLYDFYDKPSQAKPIIETVFLQ